MGIINRARGIRTLGFSDSAMWCLFEVAIALVVDLADWEIYSSHQRDTARQAVGPDA